ncbi:MAG: hypothetical protein KJO77_07515 [Bacteroidia bacterium]|nr:hypothetical protein [Bacteroidia bacterium]NND52106.1 hypothetical protein [Flavobacteriaceae bacterium]
MKTLLSLLFILASSYTIAQQTPQSTQTNTTTKTTGCVSGDCDNGWGKWVYNNGYYSGFWFNKKRSGYGMYDWTEAGKYIGWWKNDKRDGYGVYFYNEKDEMSGEFKNGELDGLGKNFKDGKWKQGVYSNGNLVTEHTFYDNKIKTGCIAGDCQNKYGRFKWSNGDVFTGFFKYGNMYMGTYAFVNGDKYSGMFNSQNKFHGNGRFFFANGEYYGGEWMDGKYNGLGYYVDKDLISQKGYWTNGVLTKSYD